MSLHPMPYITKQFIWAFFTIFANFLPQFCQNCPYDEGHGVKWAFFTWAILSKLNKSPTTTNHWAFFTVFANFFSKMLYFQTPWRFVSALGGSNFVPISLLSKKKKQSSSANCYIIFRQHTSKNEKLKAQTNAGTGHTYTIL